MLYYLRHEVIGDQDEGVFAGARFDEIDIPPPYAEGPHEPPIFWWNEDADRSLLIGTFKHGKLCRELGNTNMGSQIL